MWWHLPSPVPPRAAMLGLETVHYHPEGAPCPLDALAVFDRFVAAAVGESRP